MQEKRTKKRGIQRLPVRIYRQVRSLKDIVPIPFGSILAKFRIYLPDRPGGLAGFAATIARARGNISFFHYDRSVDSSRVAAEVQLKKEKDLDDLFQSLEDNEFSFENVPGQKDDIQITDVENILEVKVRLVNEPGKLAAFAGLLADHHANVIYMLYDEDIDAESADIAMVTESHGEIERLMKAMNEEGYYYRVLYRGADEQEVSHIIGLKMVEKFFLRLKRIMPERDIDEIRSIVESSSVLREDLVNFYKEAGNNLEVGDVFEKVLTFASRSRSRTGKNFYATRMTPISFDGGLAIYGLRMPSSENCYLLHHGDELAMIDTGHGIYYPDVKRLISDMGFDPSMVKRIFITHPDSDHAGASGYYADEFGSEVFMHPRSTDVIENVNRAHGTTGALLRLNLYFTRFSNRITECHFPSDYRCFREDGEEMAGGFRVIDRFDAGPLRFDVLESRGGHTPGMVFFLNREHGLIFTSDFLLNIRSLTHDEKEHLALYRYLLTNPNGNSRIYREETRMLKQLMLDMDAAFKRQGKTVLIFPGHGDYYPADMLNNEA